MADPNVSILIVDDMKTIRDVISSFLSKLGYKKVFEAVDGQEAMNTLIEQEKAEDPIKVVVSDWNMPNINGLELLKLIRNSGVIHIENVAFLMVTTNNEKENVLEALESGADNYLVKPVTVESLELKLNKVISKRNF